jgi:hypothetical protein
MIVKMIEKKKDSMLVMKSWNPHETNQKEMTSTMTSGMRHVKM